MSRPVRRRPVGERGAEPHPGRRGHGPDRSASSSSRRYRPGEAKARQPAGRANGPALLRAVVGQVAGVVAGRCSVGGGGVEGGHAEHQRDLLAAGGHLSVVLMGSAVVGLLRDGGCKASGRRDGAGCAGAVTIERPLDLGALAAAGGRVGHARYVSARGPVGTHGDAADRSSRRRPTRLPPTTPVGRRWARSTSSSHPDAMLSCSVQLSRDAVRLSSQPAPMEERWPEPADAAPTAEGRRPRRQRSRLVQRAGDPRAARHGPSRRSPSGSARLTGHQLPQASISAMERGFDGERRRRFDAHELYLLSVVFDVPIAYFFIPPPGPGSTELADTRPAGRRAVAQRCSVPRTQLDAVDERLAEINIENPEASRRGAGRDLRRRRARRELARALPHLAQAGGSARSRASTATASTRSPSSSTSSPPRSRRSARAGYLRSTDPGESLTRRDAGRCSRVQRGGVAMRGSVVKKGDRYYVKIELDPDPADRQASPEVALGIPARSARPSGPASTCCRSSTGASTSSRRSRRSATSSTEWLRAIEHTVRPSTFDSYSRNIRNHVIAHIGTTRLAQGRRRRRSTGCTPLLLDIGPTPAVADGARLLTARWSTGRSSCAPHGTHRWRRRPSMLQTEFEEADAHHEGHARLAPPPPGRSDVRPTTARRPRPPDGQLHPHDPAPSVQGRRPLGPARPQPSRRRRSASWRPEVRRRPCVGRRDAAHVPRRVTRVRTTGCTRCGCCSPRPACDAARRSGSDGRDVDLDAGRLRVVQTITQVAEQGRRSASRRRRAADARSPSTPARSPCCATTARRCSRSGCSSAPTSTTRASSSTTPTARCLRPDAVSAAVPAAGRKARPTTADPPRPPPHLGDAGTRAGHPPARRPGAPRPLDDRHHPRHLQPRRPDTPRRSRRARRRPGPVGRSLHHGQTDRRKPARRGPERVDTRRSAADR